MVAFTAQKMGPTLLKANCILDEFWTILGGRGGSWGLLPKLCPRFCVTNLLEILISPCFVDLGRLINDLIRLGRLVLVVLWRLFTDLVRPCSRVLGRLFNDLIRPCFLGLGGLFNDLTRPYKDLIRTS